MATLPKVNYKMCLCTHQKVTYGAELLLAFQMSKANKHWWNGTKWGKHINNPFFLEDLFMLNNVTKDYLNHVDHHCEFDKNDYIDLKYLCRNLSKYLKTVLKTNENYRDYFREHPEERYQSLIKTKQIFNRFGWNWNKQYKDWIERECVETAGSVALREWCEKNKEELRWGADNAEKYLIDICGFKPLDNNHNLFVNIFEHNDKSMYMFICSYSCIYIFCNKCWSIIYGIYLDFTI